MPVDGPVGRLPGMSQLSHSAVRPPHCPAGLPLFPTPPASGGPPSFLPASFYHQAGLLVNMYAAAAAAAVACRQASTFPSTSGEPVSYLLPSGPALRQLPTMSSKYGRGNIDDDATSACGDSRSGSFDVVRSSPREKIDSCMDTAAGLPASGLNSAICVYIIRAVDQRKIE